MECTHLCKYSSQYVWMTLSHSIVAPRYPWGVKNKSLMRSVPDPSSSCEGAGTQTTRGSEKECGEMFIQLRFQMYTTYYDTQTINISGSVITMFCLYAQFTQPYTQPGPQKHNLGKLWSPRQA